MFNKIKKIIKDAKENKQGCCGFEIKEVDGQANEKDKNGNKSCCSFDFVNIEEKENNKKKEIVKERYARIIKDKNGKGCCSTQEDQIPSFGVGNPLKYADLNSGDFLIDIGSGPGKNCLKAAESVKEKGKVIGLDMTKEMILSAEKQAKKEGHKNVEFVLGDAEDIPFAENYFDVTISDCVINLVPDKRKVFLEIYRVLKDGGQMVISDVVSDKEFPSKLKEDKNLWCGCVSGALPEDKYLDIIREVGFKNLKIVERKDAQQDIEEINISHLTIKAIK